MNALFSPGPFREVLISNLIVAALVLLGVWTGRAVRRNQIWRNAFAQVFSRRRFSASVLVFFAAVALMDSIVWVGGTNSTAGDQVAAHEARSPIDRAFASHGEKSYSAPLAGREFYDESPLTHPGTHPFGTNVLGQDVLYLTLKGAKVALLIGGLTSLIAIPLALFFGILAGYFGGRIDDVVFFVMSTLASMPGILLLIALIMVLGQSTFSVCLALGVTSWVGFCRLARGETMKLRELDFIAAARALGVRDRVILVRHVLPNLMHLVVITFVLMFSGLVLSEATLAWLGIGVSGSWGQMIAQAKDELSRDPLIWWNVTAAGAALFSLVLAVNRVGDALRDELDPRTRGGEAVMALEVRGLTTSFPVAGRLVPIVDDVSFVVEAGRCLALVGESGSGKSMTALSLLRLVPRPGRITAGEVQLAGQDLRGLSIPAIRHVRGHKLAMIFQEPMTSLNPVVRVGEQVAEAILLHERVGRVAARERVLALFERVGIPEPRARFDYYPHQMSGGLKQRVMISMALATRPDVLIADEPTTALDVTIQAQLLELLRDLQQEFRMGILLITHDLGVVNQLADDVAVMYAGRIVEQGPTRELLTAPQHPYTRGLLASLPSRGAPGEKLYEIAGVVPAPADWPAGCRFCARCPEAFEPCNAELPLLLGATANQRVACHARARERGAGHD